VAVVVLKRLVQISTSAGSGSISKTQTTPVGIDQLLLSIGLTYPLVAKKNWHRYNQSKQKTNPQADRHSVIKRKG
jgi:hypothetical protein